MLNITLHKDSYNNNNNCKGLKYILNIVVQST